VYELEDLIEEGPALTISLAPGIDDASQIVCAGTLGTFAAIRLDPLERSRVFPEPARAGARPRVRGDTTG